MSTYAFTLIAHGLSDLDEAPAEAIFEAGCDDCHMGSGEGRVHIYFEREAKSLEAAVGSAVLDLKKAGVSAWLESVGDPDEVADEKADDVRAPM